MHCKPSLPGLARTGRLVGVYLALALLLFWGLVLNVNMGSVPIPAGEILAMVWRAIRAGLADLVPGGDRLEAITAASTASRIVFSIRMPRMLLAAILGGALSVSGYLLQVFFRNPIAGPFVLGISTGARMVVGITLIFLAPMAGSLGSASLVLAAFAGSLLVTGVVLLFARRAGNMSMLLLIGIMMGYICSAVTDFCITFANDNDIVNLTSWSMGSFSGASWENVRLAAVICLAGTVACWLLSKPMGAYALGEEYAATMGVNVRLFRVGLILLSSLLSACVTALAGPVSFVGIAVPHITRQLLGTSRPILIIPAAFLCGGVFCVFCDLVARTAFAPTELAIGTVTSAFGAPIVIAMMVRRRRQEEE